MELEIHDKPKAFSTLRSLFLVWGTPAQGPRSRVLAGELGVDVHFLHTGLPQGGLYAPLKYAVLAIRTLWLLFRKRPDVVFVQSPPILAVLFTHIYCGPTGGRYIVDAHSAAFRGPSWRLVPMWLKRYLTREAVTTLVTNSHLQQAVKEMGGNAFLLRDVAATFPAKGQYPLKEGFRVAVVNTFSVDEPLSEILQAAANLPDVHFYVTGRLSQRNAEVVSWAPGNAHFTGFIDEEAYYSLLGSVDAVMCLTTRDHTMQRGAAEALWLGRPIITSDWPVLRDYFHQGAVFVDNSAEGIRAGVLRMNENHAGLERQIKALQLERRQEWREKIESLTCLITERATT